jgi:tetratricopeptide (TPR) repeat protein
MEPETAWTGRKHGGLDRRLSLFAVRIVCLALLPAVDGALAPSADQPPFDSKRAQTALSEIAGAAAPAPVTTPPLDQAPAVREALEQARSRVDGGAFQSALETLSDLAETPAADRSEYHYLIAAAKTGLRHFDQALPAAEAAARLGHGEPQVHYLLAGLYLQQGRLDLAIRQYRSVTLAAERDLNNPNVTLAWYFLGQTLSQAGYVLAAAESLGQFDAAVWRTHPEQRNAAEISALLAGRSHAGWPSGPAKPGPTIRP